MNPISIFHCSDRPLAAGLVVIRVPLTNPVMRALRAEPPPSSAPASEGPIDRWWRQAEIFGAGRGHVEAILQPHSELAWNINARFVGEAHAGRQRRGFAVN